MKILRAEHYGFCYGVQRALDVAQKCGREASGEVHTLGPLIHNPQAVERLAQEGVHSADSLNEIAAGTVIIRSHGVGPEVYQAAERKGLTVVDATCPHVQKAQRSAQKLSDEGFQVVIIGERHHPEVQSIMQWAGADPIILETSAVAERLSHFPKIGVVAQTTFNRELFQQIVDILKTKTQELKVEQTICLATQQRQAAAADLAGRVDVMVVIGGKNSANTTHLADICRQTGAAVYHIETADELRWEWFAGADSAGITAGASTPDWIIEEVITKMQEFDQMTDQGAAALEAGMLVKGKVVSIQDNEVMVDIGNKSEGVVPLAELAFPVPEKASDVVKLEEVIDLYVLDPETPEGGVKLSKVKADQIVAWDKLDAASAEGQRIAAKVTAVVKGGLSVSVFGIRGFIPASQTDLRYVEDLASFAGQTVEVVPIEIDRDKNRVVLSRRKVLEEERRAQEEEAYQRLTVGQHIKGTVRRLASFGAFVDVGGVDGLLHISDMAWNRVKSPDEVVNVGDEIEVEVIRVDPAAKKISLSLKNMQNDPWLDQVNEFAEGMTVKGKVTKLAKFGAFVEIKSGLEGLVHISEIADHRIATPDEVLQAGQEVQVKILGIDKKGKKISLSISGAKQDVDRAEYKHYMSSEDSSASLNVTIGDRFGHLFKRED